MLALGRERLFVPLVGLLVLSAWLLLFSWDMSPYARYLHHGQWTELGPSGGLCLVPLADGPLVPVLFYVGGWVLMTTAMMLPTTLPLLEAFRRLTQSRQDHWLLMALVIAGYLGAWSVFGLAAHGLDWGVHQLAQRSMWLIFNSWILGAVVFCIAGLFQFSSLKYRCLDKCRAPLGFVMRHWNGQSERRHALLLGLDHGVYCVGCCWAMMLLMFVLGTGSVGWMLLLGGVMAAEKNLPFGHRLAAPLGIALLAGAAAIVVQHLGFTTLWTGVT
jgi:predicted metal-binding membrane protein